MASLSSTHRPYRLSSQISTLSNNYSLQALFHFCSSSSPEPPIDQSPNPADAEIAISSPVTGNETETTDSPPALRRRRASTGNNYETPEKIEDIIRKMMSRRAWTTRLQNSIRRLVPEFDNQLVYNVLHGSKNSEQALQFFRWVERAGLFRHNRETHFKIIQILSGASKLNHARCILMDMPKKGVDWDEDLWEALIYGYGKAGIVQESVKLFQKMEELGIERTSKSYDTLFKVILRRGRYMMAKRYHNKMLSEGVTPTLHTYNILIWGFFLSKKIETANRFFEDMKSREISPNVVTYNTMINGYYRVEKIEEAEKLFVELKGKNLEPTVITYTTMIKGYVSAGRIDDGLGLFREMKSKGVKPNDVTYSTLLPGLCEGERLSEAQTILNEMVEKFIAPKDNSIFMKLILGHCKAGDTDSADNVLKSMMRLSIPTEAGHYGVLIENFCRARLYDRAVKLLDKLIEKNLVLRPESSFNIEPDSYNLIIEYLCENGLTEKAETFFRQLMKTGILDPIGFNNLIHGHSREGKPESASEILKIMVRRKVNAEESSYALLINSFLKKNEPADAKLTLDSMIENGHSPDSSLYISVMKSLFDDGRVQTASRVMKIMLEKGIKDDKDLFGKILEALLMRGHVEEALGRIELMMKSGCEPDLDNILAVLCEKGKTIAALKLIDFGLERDFRMDFSSYDKVLDALLAAGKTLNAYSILCKILEKGGKTDQSNCEGLIKSLNEEGNTRQADILSRLMTGKDKAPFGKKGKKMAPVAS